MAMIELKIANPTIGEFVWSPPPNIQAKLLELPPEVLQAFQVDLCAHINGYLLSLTSLVLEMGSVSAAANASDLAKTMLAYNQRALERMITERDAP